MFGQKTVEVKVVDETKVKELNKIIEVLQREKADLIADQTREISNIKQDFESEKRIYIAEAGIKVAEAVKTTEEKNVTLSSENAVLKEKTVLLEKAFDNMGFDVKDMKSILDKLVDGLVAGNKVNIIKTE